MAYSKLASAIYNDVMSGLRGYTSNVTLSMEQLEDEIVEERMALIKMYTMKGILPKHDLLRTVTCIPIDCRNIENCEKCGPSNIEGTPTMHFEIPMLLTDFGNLGIDYIGSTDLQTPFNVYTRASTIKYRKYRKWQTNRPYVYVNVTPNKNNKCDCWVYNAPFLKQVTVIGVFKDERQLPSCGECEDTSKTTFLDSEIKDRLTKRKLQYYRQFIMPPQSNDQIPK